MRRLSSIFIRTPRTPTTDLTILTVKTGFFWKWISLLTGCPKNALCDSLTGLFCKSDTTGGCGSTSKGGCLMLSGTRHWLEYDSVALLYRVPENVTLGRFP